MAQDTSVVGGRVSRAAAYVEPELYAVVQSVAERSGGTISTWLRKLIMRELIARGELSNELLVKLAMD